MQRWLTPHYLNFFLGSFLALQVGLFLYLESTSGVTDRQDRIRGRDFLHFYLAGQLVADGRVEQLYDQHAFLELQKSISPVDEKNPPYVSVYPPHSALFFSSLGWMSYPRAIECWWLVQLVCVISVAMLLMRWLIPPKTWRFTCWLGILAFYPVLNTFWNGQISALLLLCFVAGLTLHRREHQLAAGLIFSLVSLKPQLALGLYLWLLLRRDWHTLLGVFLGGVVQLILVISFMGYETLVEYVHNARLASAWYAIYTMSPDHQHALAGILTTWFGNAFSLYSMLIQGVVALIAGLCLWKLLRTPVEYAAAIIFTMCCAPHLLTYDLSCLLMATACLLSQIQHHRSLLKPIVLLYGSAMIAPLYVTIQVSLVPVAMLFSLFLLVNQRVSLTARRSLMPTSSH
jgi:hypothetical protein